MMPAAARSAGWSIRLTRTKPVAAHLGWLPAVTIGAGTGLIAVALAGQAAVQRESFALALWWIGILAICVPPFVRLWSKDASRVERAALVTFLGAALYAAQLLASPLDFKAPDEFSHLRTFNDLVSSGHALAPNPLLLISPSYPGLEAGTAALGFASGLPVFPAGVALLVAARIALMLALFLLSEGVSGSARIAGLGAALYAANPSYLLFDAQWSYESLALTLAAFALWATWSWSHVAANRMLYATAMVVMMVATTVTHHLTSFVLAVTLVLWAVVAWLRPGGSDRRRIVAAGAIAVTANVSWLLLFAAPAVGYLAEIVYGALEGFVRLGLEGGSGGRPLFRSLSGYEAPRAEIIVGYVGTALLLLVLLAAGIHLLRRHMDNPLMILFGISAALLPATLALRLTGVGAETSQRASGFLYVGVSLLVADWLVHASPGIRTRLMGAAVAGLLTLVLAAGIVLGSAWFTRLPGPYHVAAEQLSVEPQGKAAAAWAREELGPGNRIITDRTNQKLFASIGGQDPVTAFNSGLGTAWVTWGPSLTETDLRVIRDGRIDYVLVDLRTSRDTPIFPYYYEPAEPDAGTHSEPWPATGLEKFEQLPGVARVFDSGDLILYDVRSMRDE
jgi:hypothetical protein